MCACGNVTCDEALRPSPHKSPPPLRALARLPQLPTPGRSCLFSKQQTSHPATICNLHPLPPEWPTEIPSSRRQQWRAAHNWRRLPIWHHHASHITHHTSRITHHASRMTLPPGERCAAAEVRVGRAGALPVLSERIREGACACVRACVCLHVNACACVRACVRAHAALPQLCLSGGGEPRGWPRGAHDQALPRQSAENGPQGQRLARGGALLFAVLLCA